jgi:hypothetical protein
MDVQEISSRLDSALLKASGGLVLDEYVKSLYLTKAQSLFVETVLGQYEYGEVLRHILGSMLVDVEETSFTPVTGQPDMYDAVPPIDIKSIVYEEVNAQVETIPLDYNDIHDSRVNPFRKPYKKLAYRITGSEKLTIFSTETLARYYFTYCKEPDPIVLEAIPTELAINGIDVEQGSELPYDSILKVIDITVQEIMKDIAKFQPQKQEVKK